MGDGSVGCVEGELEISLSSTYIVWVGSGGRRHGRRIGVAMTFVGVHRRYGWAHSCSEVAGWLSLIK